MSRPENDSGSDDVPYLPPDQYQNYENQQRIHQSQNPENRRGRSFFTDEELHELDSIPLDNDSVVTATPATVSSIPRPTSEPDVIQTTHVKNPDRVQNEIHTLSLPPPTQDSRRHTPRPSIDSSIQMEQPRQISWGRRTIGLLLIAVPAVLFSVAAHFLDWAMSDFQLFSASFFIFQGIFWPCFGILLSDILCTPRKHVSKNQESMRVQKGRPSRADNEVKRTTKEKWILAFWIFIQSNLSATIMILQILSIQRLNISISLALSFGFDVVVILIRYIMETRRCSWELVILTIISYAGYGVTAVPAWTSSSEATRQDIASGVGASVGVMLLGVPASFILTYLRRHQVRESVLGTSFAAFGWVQALITKEIMGDAFDMRLDGQAVGWVAGLISVVFLGTIFLHLEARLSGLIWERDEDDKPPDFSSITRTRIAVFILSCLWELARQGFRDTKPVVYDIIGGVLVMLSFLLAGGYQAWHRSNQATLVSADNSAAQNSNAKFCAFVPWLIAQKPSRIYREND